MHTASPSARPRLLTVLGARPQFIKAAAVSRALARAGRLDEVLVHTGQHFDAAMSEVFFTELEIAAPAHHLGVSGGPHGAQTGRMLERIEEVLVAERPAAVLVYGDTTSTLAGALAAAKLHIPVVHVEAGLRSFNRRMPEEVNRVLTDHVSDLLFVPTGAAMRNLEREGIAGERVHLVGDVMFDAAAHFAAVAEARGVGPEAFGVPSGGYVLATLHRQENTDDLARLGVLVDALAEVARCLPVVLPLHPRTRNALRAAGLLDRLAAAVHVTEPLGYLDLVTLERHARVVATDSGGVQKEAFFHGVPCITLRDETEWVELVELGANRVVPPVDAAAVARAILEAAPVPAAAGSAAALYGGGHASARIADALGTHLAAP